MPIHAIHVNVGDSPASAEVATRGATGGAGRSGAPRLRAIPSKRPGVADVPLSPTAQQRFYAVHDALSIGARAVTGADDFERDLKRDEDELAEHELVQMQNDDGHDQGSQHGDTGTNALRSLSTSQASSSQGRESEAEVERSLLGPRVTATQETPSRPSRAGHPALHLYGLAEENSVPAFGDGDEDQEDRIEDPDSSPSPEAEAVPGLQRETEDEGPPDEYRVDENEAITGGELRPASQGTVNYSAAVTESTPNDEVRARVGRNQAATAGDNLRARAETSEPAEIQQFLDFWHAHVSQIYPPHVWYRQQVTTSTLGCSGTLPPSYSCKLTLVMPNATKRTFETAATYSDKSTARLRAFSDARDSDVLVTAKRLREEVGWQVEEQEMADERGKIKSLKGGEKPWETLRAEQERWMAPPIVVKVDKDELNAVYGSTLSIQISALSPPLAFTAPAAFPSAREARAAAARLALEADVPAQYQCTFNGLIKRVQHGYIQVGDYTATEAARTSEIAHPERQQAHREGVDAKVGGNGTDQEGHLNAVDTLHEHVKAAFGSRKMWVNWAYGNAEQDSGKTARGPSNLGATLTVRIPVTEKHPSAPPPFVVATENRYRSKHYARLACATSAYKKGLLDVLEPYRKEREGAKREKLVQKAKHAEEKREEREVGRLRETPQAGTVKYEDLVLLPDPAGYLNICAQQWTGNGSPLKFEYTTRTDDDSNIKLYGCALTVLVNISFSRTYEVAPSPEYRNRAAAKEAAVRLALGEHVLDLLTPAGFDPSAPPLTAAAASRLARAARGREPMPTESACTSGGTSAVGATAPRAKKAPSLQSRDAVSRLDEFVQDWVGPDCLPQYEIFRDDHSGLYGGSLCIPFASGMAHEDFEDLSSKRVPVWSRTMNFDARSVSRPQAQQLFAQSAFDDGIVDFMHDQVPRHNKAAPHMDACVRCIGSFGHKHERSESDEEGDAHGHLSGWKAEKTALGAATFSRKRFRLDLADQGEFLVGKEGGSVERLRLGCCAILGCEAKVGPRYKTERDDYRYDARVTIPLDPEGADWRVFDLPSGYATRDLAYEAAASTALAAGVLELIESRVRPKPRVAPPFVPPAQSKLRGSAAGGQPGGITLPAQVPKYGEELAAARRAMYGGFGKGAELQLGELIKKIEAEAQVEQELEQARRDERRKADELRRMGNPLLPGVPTTPEAPAPSYQSEDGSGMMTTAALVELRAYCEQHHLVFPRIYFAPLAVGSTSTSTESAARARVWLFLRGLKFELPRVKAAVAEERLAAKVLGHLKKLDGERAADEEAEAEAARRR